MKYNNVGGITQKTQHHERDQQIIHENTYDNKYEYVQNTHKLEKVSDALTGNGETFEYDFNGNAVNHYDNLGTKRMYWDEQERLKAFYNDISGTYQYYSYDDKGERVIKYGLEAPSQLYQNGAPLNPDELRLFEYKIYPNPYVTVSSTGQYTKHYFEGSKRFASRLMDGAVRFEDPAVLYSSRTADDKPPTKPADSKSDFEQYLEKAGLGSGISLELRERLWSPDLYYLHGDHLGTATFVTNSQAEATQFFLNLPFGETMIEQMDGSYDNPFKFNAKELDDDTGLYYYGARYYNPRLSIWYGVDPLADKMPSWSPYAYAFDNPVKFIDPDGREPLDWYQNNKTGNYEWKDTTKEIKGYRHVGKSGSVGSSADGYDRMYYLHANGSATVKTGDSKTTLMHAEGGEVLGMIAGGTITTSATSVSGLATQVSYNQQIAGSVGVTGSIGFVADSYGGTFGGKFYYSYGFSLSNSSGFSFDFNTIKATDPETLFNVSDFKAFGNSFTAGFGGAFSWGGSSPVQSHDGVNLLNKTEWGAYPGGYSTFGVSYGVQKKPSFGVSMSRTQTRFVSDIPKDWR